MKWERSDLYVGLAVLGAVLIAIGAVLWLLPTRDGDTAPLYADFDRIDGIAELAPVQLHGYPIGRVQGIEPRVGPDGQLRFRVRMNISWQLESGEPLPLPQGTVALLTPPPVPIGSGVIVLQPPASGADPLRPGAVVPGVRAVSPIDQVQALSTDLAGEVAKTLVTSRALMDSLMRTTSSAARVVDATGAALPPLLAGVQRELDSAETLTRELRIQIATLAPAATASIDSASALLADSRRLVQDTHRLLAQREPELVRIVANLDTASVFLNHFVQQVSARPTRALTGVAPPPSHPRARRAGDE